MERFISQTHKGYMAGLRGEDPDLQLSQWSEGEYSEAYLIGCADREAGVKEVPYLGQSEEQLPFKNGSMVKILKGTLTHTIGKEPKQAGRTYTVKVNHTIGGNQAYFQNKRWNERELVRPTTPSVVWPGTGGYWTDASINDVASAE